MSENLEKRIRSRSIQKHDLEVNWNKATSFVPYKGEFIIYDIEVDEEGNDITQTVDGVEKTVYELVGRTTPYTYERFKIGDGKTPVIDLPFTINAHNNIYYGVCDTASSTKAKTVDIADFILQTGTMVIIKFTNSNSATAPTLNVSGTGAKPIYQYGTLAVTASVSNGWASGAVQFFIYDGTGWVRDYWQNSTILSPNAELGFGFGHCYNDGTSLVVDDLSRYQLRSNGIVSIHFSNSVPAGATLNIRNTGAKAIYIQDGPITDNIITDDDTATFIYDGNYYRLLSIDCWGKDIANINERLNTIIQINTWEEDD